MSTSPGTALTRAIDRLAEDFGHLRIVDGNRNDLEPDALRVFRHEVSRLVGIDLDSEHRDATRRLDHAANSIVVVDEMRAPIVVVFWRSHMSVKYARIVRARGDSVNGLN